MSLDVYLTEKQPDHKCVCPDCGHEHTAETWDELFSANITHNLAPMARAAGLYDCLWRPDENEMKHARIGSKSVTYTPPGPSDASRYDRLVFRCEVVALRLDGVSVDEIAADADYSRRDVRADLHLPDGTKVLDVPYCDQADRDPSAYDGSSWCRPYISSATVRYGR